MTTTPTGTPIGTPSPSPTPTSTRASLLARWRPGPPLLGLFAGWIALIAWSDMVADPWGFLRPTLVVGLLVVLLGTGLRALDLPAYAVALVQLLAALVCLNALYASKESLIGLVPTEASVRRTVFVINNGAATLNHYSAPVEVNPTHTAAMLMACGLAVLLSIDIIAMGLRRPPLIALPLLIALSVPVSILRGSLALPVFVLVSLLFLRLLAAENLERVRGWGDRSEGNAGAATRWWTPGDRTGAGAERPTKVVLSTLWQVSIGAVLVALLAAPLIPVTDLLNRNRGDIGTGGGSGRYELTSDNPLVRLRRDLLVKQHIPLLYATTNARSTSYIRTAVLDEFTNDAWRPSPRQLPESNDANGPIPSPPGLDAGVGSTESTWSFQLAQDFTTTWLPLPYPIRELRVPGIWRYDSRTLDVAYIGGASASELKYRVKAFTPSINARLLDSALRPPREVRDTMTDVPDDLPSEIEDQARKVTSGAESDFAKAVALQDWFRSSGGFRYSLEQRGGSGMGMLASFVTDDRVGYCEQFAAAMAAMGRVLGIPSRVVVGFLDGTAQPDGQILYTSDDRHAWPEMYFSGVGWVRFEPTPGQRAGSTPAYTRESTDIAAPSAAPSPGQTQNRSAVRDRPVEDTSTDKSTGFPVPWWPVAALLVVLVLGLVPGLVRRVQRQRRLAGNDPVHLAEGAWAELRATALDLGLSWPERRSPREQARSVVDQVNAERPDLESLEALLVRVERGRYARGAVAVLDADARATTVGTVSAWRKVMVSSVHRERGLRGRVWPMSLLRRGR
jgi:transglutaminase-like putative cysteine protease